MPNQTTIPLNIDPVTLQLTGTVTVPAGGSGPAPTQRGYDAVADLDLDPTGQLDCSVMLEEWINTSGADNELHFPAGRYYFAHTVETNAKNVKLTGDGKPSRRGAGAVTFFTDLPLDAILWWNCAEEASNLEGPTIANIQFQDTSANHNQLGCAIHLTNIANTELHISFLDMIPDRYTGGTVTVNQGSKSVKGNGVDWSGISLPAWMVVAGYPYEITKIVSPTQLNIALAYIGPSAAGASYGINFHGIGVWADPGLDFTQYGTAWSLDGRIACALFCSAGTGSTGTSRLKIQAGYLNGAGIADSMAAYMGPFSDTNEWHVAMNSYAFGIVVADGHQHQLLDADYENAGSPPPVSGMPNDYSACKGILIMADNSSDTWGNRVGGYFRQVGTAIELYGRPGTAPTWTVIGPATFRSNSVNFINGNATNTQGMIPSALFEDAGGYIGNRRSLLWWLLRCAFRIQTWILRKAAA